jgi:uncharacterized protein (TIGR03435 family)
MASGVAWTPKSTKRALGVAGLLAAGAIVAASQSQPPAHQKFEVASIRPNNSGRPRGYTNPFTYAPNGRFTATNVTLVDVIVSGVYQTRRIQMRGGPDWIDSDRFDIAAQADAIGGEFKEEEFYPMIRALLEDRFKLALHRETKEMSVYALVPGKNRPKLQESKEGEEAIFRPGNRGQMTFQRMPMVALVNTLANILKLQVVDGTGITGTFDFTLDPLQFETGGGPTTAASYADLVLTAVQTQLGLRLEKRNAPVEITVIDHAERPSEN